jgi:hypothetical protein
MMKKKLVRLCVLLVCIGIFVFPCQAQPAREDVSFDGRHMPGEDLIDDVDDLFYHESITKEIDGTVDDVGDDFIIVRDVDDEQVKLLIDAETVIYIEEKKARSADIAAGDTVFAFYIDEGGFLKCDLLDVIKK